MFSASAPASSTWAACAEAGLSPACLDHLLLLHLEGRQDHGQGEGLGSGHVLCGFQRGTAPATTTMASPWRRERESSEGKGMLSTGTSGKGFIPALGKSFFFDMTVKGMYT